jgi:hypothetical protein
MKTRGFKELQGYLADLKDDKTLRQIAEEDFDNKVTHGVIARCIKGIEPKDEMIREILSLPELITQEFWRDAQGRRIETPKENSNELP